MLGITKEKLKFYSKYKLKNYEKFTSNNSIVVHLPILI